MLVAWTVSRKTWRRTRNPSEPPINGTTPSCEVVLPSWGQIAYRADGFAPRQAIRPVPHRQGQGSARCGIPTSAFRVPPDIDVQLARTVGRKLSAHTFSGSRGVLTADPETSAAEPSPLASSRGIAVDGACIDRRSLRARPRADASRIVRSDTRPPAIALRAPR